MNAPRMLLGITLVFWGYYSNVIIISIAMAFFLELHHSIKGRQPISTKNFYMIGDVCTAILIIISAIAFFYNQQRLFIYQIVAWLPFVFYPLVLAELYSDRKHAPIGAIIYRYRKLRNSSSKDFSIGYLYFFICILGASATSMHTIWFLPVVVALIAIVLWHQKLKSTHFLRWSLLIILSGGIGFLFSTSLVKLNAIAEKYSMDLMDALMNFEQDPYQTTTAMGKVGKLKLSNNIVMRIQMQNNSLLSPGQSFLLQEAVYNVFYENAWFNRELEFVPLVSDSATNSWNISTPTPDNLSATLKIYLQRELPRGLLPITSRTSKVVSETNLQLSQNALGVIKFRSSPDLSHYTLRLNKLKPTNASKKLSLTKSDLFIPQNLRRTIRRISDNLLLGSSRPTEVAIKLQNYFSDEYTYSTYQRYSNISQFALDNFLRNSHSGHCEFFASASVFLLRSVGIPARYTVGYSVQEFDRDENIYIVRARHRHAWAKAFIDGKWVNIDTTPSEWLISDLELASLFEPVSDWISHLIFQLKHSEFASSPNSEFYKYLAFVLLSLILFFYMRKNNTRGAKEKRGRKELGKIESVTPLRTPTQIQPILEILDKLGMTWKIHEPLFDRVEKSKAYITEAKLQRNFHEIIGLYYKVRFDITSKTPLASNSVDRNDSKDDQALLQQKINAWLLAYNANQKSNL